MIAPQHCSLCALPSVLLQRCYASSGKPSDGSQANSVTRLSPRLHCGLSTKRMRPAESLVVNHQERPRTSRRTPCLRYTPLGPEAGIDLYLKDSRSPDLVCIPENTLGRPIFNRVIAVFVTVIWVFDRRWGTKEVTYCAAAA